MVKEIPDFLTLYAHIDKDGNIIEYFVGYEIVSLFGNKNVKIYI